MEILVNNKFKNIVRFKYYKNDYYFIPNNEFIYVFSSSVIGGHQLNLGNIAQQYFNAQLDVCYGISNNSYIIPIYDRFIRVLDLKTIRHYVDMFSEYTHSRPDKKFWITDITKSKKMYGKDKIAPLFRNCNKNNCFFPISWQKYL